MKNLLIVYHSQGGGTQEMADAVLAGAREEPAVETRLVRAFDATLEDLFAANAVVFGTPENFGYMSGALKDFFDRTFYPAQGKVDQLPYAIFVKCGNDGSGAVQHIDRIARGYPLRKVAEPVIQKGEISPGVLEQCRELGQTMAAGLAFGIF